jgi:hypothetical protein
MGVSRLIINENKLHAQIQTKKNKPVTKSKWQKRMESLAKQQETAAAQQRNGGFPVIKQRGNSSLHNKKKRK